MKRPRTFVPGLAVVCCCSWLWLAGCPESSSSPADASASSDLGGKIDVEWSQDMSDEELRAAAEEAGIELPPDATREEIIAKLEEATGCGCFGAVCGTGACDHVCGEPCQGLGESCFGGVCETPSSCPNLPAAVADTASATLVEDDEDLTLIASLDVQSQVLQRVVIRVARTTSDPLEPGSYHLRATATNDCDVCVVGYGECHGNLCSDIWVSEVGVVEIVRAGDVLEGTIRELKLSRHYRDEMTSALVPLGEDQVWCVGELDFEVPVTHEVVPPDPPPPVFDPSTCNPDGTGREIGQQIKDFSLPNCLGESVSLHGMCGAKAVWVVGTTGWCGACKSRLPVVAGEFAEHENDGLQMLVVFSEDSSGAEPSPAACTAYAQATQVDPARMVIDKDFKTLFGAMDSGAGGVISLPWEGVLDGRGMVYVWNRKEGGGAQAAVDQLLSQ